MTDPVKRLTAEQVLTEVERIIVMWRNIAPGDKAGTLQVKNIREKYFSSEKYFALGCASLARRTGGRR